MATIRATVYNKYGSIIFTMHEQLNDSNFFFWNDIFYFDSMTTLTLINNCVFRGITIKFNFFHHEDENESKVSFIYWVNVYMNYLKT